MKIEPHELDVVLNAFLSYGECHLPPKACRRLTAGLDRQTKTVFLMRLWGWTEERIAEELGLSQPYVSKIVSRKLSVVKRRITQGMVRIEYEARRSGKRSGYILNKRAGYDLADANPDYQVFEPNMPVTIEHRGHALAQPEGSDVDGVVTPGFTRKHHERVAEDDDPVAWDNNQPSYDALDREVRAYCESLKLFGM